MGLGSIKIKWGRAGARDMSQNVTRGIIQFRAILEKSWPLFIYEDLAFFETSYVQI